MRVLRYLLLGSLMALLACSFSSSQDSESITEADIYEAAQDQLDREQWEPAIANLRALEENFPFGTFAEQAQLELIYAYHRSSQPEMVAATADRFIRLHPQHRNVDYAFYMKGVSAFSGSNSFVLNAFSSDMSQRDLGEARESLSHFSQLINRFPESPYVSDAKQRMLHLRNILARYEIHVANYHFKRGAYLAATNRGRYVLEHFHKTPAVPDALAVMAQGYHLMKMPERSKQYQELLRLNYPEHPALKPNGEFDFDYSWGTGKRSFLHRITLGILDKDEPIGFDSRELYNTEYQKAPKPKAFGIF